MGLTTHERAGITGTVDAQVPAGPVVAIAGPTATGKSKLARQVAQRLGTNIVSVDAMQVYRGMDVGTAKDRGTNEVRVLMVDVAEVTDEYSVAVYQRGARACVDRALLTDGVAVICGGTGLYLDAVIDDIAYPAGGMAAPSRVRWESFARQHGPAALHAELSRRDPDSAALIHPNNVRRVARALELLDAGVSYADQNRGLHRRRPYYDARVFALTMTRSSLYERIERRVDAMFASGLVEEVSSLVEAGLDRTTTAGQAIGYKEVLDYLDGTCSLDETISRIKTRTRHYAKRQLSWLRRRDDVRWLDLDTVDLCGAADAIVGSVFGQGALRSADGIVATEDSRGDW